MWKELTHIGQLREWAKLKFENVKDSDIRYFTVKSISDNRIFIRHKKEMGFECNIDMLLGQRLRRYNLSHCPTCSVGHVGHMINRDVLIPRTAITSPPIDKTRSGDLIHLASNAFRNMSEE